MTRDKILAAAWAKREAANAEPDHPDFKRRLRTAVDEYNRIKCELYPGERNARRVMMADTEAEEAES